MQTEWDIKVAAVERCFQGPLYLGQGGKKRVWIWIPAHGSQKWDFPAGTRSSSVHVVHAHTLAWLHLAWDPFL